jgi:hypothetical protein
MGLDMYAYVAAKESDHTSDSDSRELAYWRKHPNLHGWFEALWESKGKPRTGDTDATFNGIELELNWEDLDQLEVAVTEGTLPATSGFFFGNPADEYYREVDLKFIREARAEIFTGLRVFYNSSW